MTPRTDWPTDRARRALGYVFVLCSTIVLGLGAAVYRTTANFHSEPDTRHKFLGIPIDSFHIEDFQEHHGARFLVALGEPPIFAVAIALLFVVAMVRGDRRLAYIAVLAPLSAEIITEIIAKPTIHRMAGTFYAYPSGHVTASASIMAVFALLLRRLAPRAIALTAAPLIALYVVGSCAGVIVLNMHDLIDAVGGAAVGIGMTAFWTVIAVEWPARARHRGSRGSRLSASDPA